MIEQTSREHGSPSNLLRPILLDVHDQKTWEAASDSSFDVDGVIISERRHAIQNASPLIRAQSANLLHCSPPDTLPAIITGLKGRSDVSERRKPWLAIYGAFRSDDGSFASEADEKVRVASDSLRGTARSPFFRSLTPAFETSILNSDFASFQKSLDRLRNWNTSW